MKTEINIDSTSLGRSSCILHFWRHVGEGYTFKTLTPALTYGIAIHKFIDMMYQTGGIYPKAMEKAMEMFRLPTSQDDKKPWMRDEGHFRATCFNVWSVHINEDKNFEVIVKPDGKPATEITFSFKYFEDETVIINLQGTIDSIGKITNGCYAIRDFKTTGSWDTKAYWTQYEMSRQLRIYTIACKLMAKMEPNSVLGKIGAQQMGAFIDAIFLTTKPNDVGYDRSIVYQYKEEDLHEFQMTLDDTCKKLSQAIKTGYFPKEGLVNGTCESKWSDGEKGKCEFWNVCKVNPTVASLLLNRDFVKKPFKPLEYNI